MLTFLRNDDFDDRTATTFRIDSTDCKVMAEQTIAVLNLNDSVKQLRRLAKEKVIMTKQLYEKIKASDQRNLHDE